MAHGSLQQFKAFQERRNERKDKHVEKFEKDAAGYKSSDSPQEYDFPELGESELEKANMNTNFPVSGVYRSNREINWKTYKE